MDVELVNPMSGLLNLNQTLQVNLCITTIGPGQEPNQAIVDELSKFQGVSLAVSGSA